MQITIFFNIKVECKVLRYEPKFDIQMILVFNTHLHNDTNTNPETPETLRIIDN